MNEKPRNTIKGETAVSPKPSPASERDSDALYQSGRVAARASGVEVDLELREVRFDEISNSDDLLLPEECEYRNYRILIQRIAHAAKIDRNAPQKGRVLRGVTADLLGYRQQ